MYIYAYTKQSHQTHPDPEWNNRVKIGQTKRYPEERILEQGAQNDDPLVRLFAWLVVDGITDFSVHKKLEELGHQRIVKEWFLIEGTPDEQVKSINECITILTERQQFLEDMLENFADDFSNKKLSSSEQNWQDLINALKDFTECGEIEFLFKWQVDLITEILFVADGYSDDKHISCIEPFHDVIFEFLLNIDVDTVDSMVIICDDDSHSNFQYVSMNGIEPEIIWLCRQLEFEIMEEVRSHRIPNKGESVRFIRVNKGQKKN